VPVARDRCEFQDFRVCENGLGRPDASEITATRSSRPGSRAIHGTGEDITAAVERVGRDSERAVVSADDAKRAYDIIAGIDYLPFAPRAPRPLTSRSRLLADPPTVS
jgi:hypothetical protein